jgi:hypothetical protein
MGIGTRWVMWPIALGRHQAHGVTHALQLAGPVVGAAAGFHANQAGRQVHEEGGHLFALERLVEHGPAMLIHAVALKYVLGQVDGRNLHGGRSCWVGVQVLTPVRWHF